MSIWITGYTEARIKDKWHCIDFYQYDTSGQLHHIPCIEGQSLVREALEWNCKVDDIMGPPDDLSDEVRRMCTSKEGVLFGTGDQRWYSWRIVEGSWFAKANLSLPETCGFFPRQDVCDYLSNPDENELNLEKVLSAEEYQALDPEVKKAYQYFEYTDPSGSRRILHDFKSAVIERISAFNDNLSWENRDQEISLDKVRVLILQG